MISTPNYDEKCKVRLVVIITTTTFAVQKKTKIEKVFSKKMIFTKNLLFGRSTDW